MYDPMYTSSTCMLLTFLYLSQFSHVFKCSFVLVSKFIFVSFPYKHLTSLNVQVYYLITLIIIIKLINIIFCTCICMNMWKGNWNTTTLKGLGILNQDRRGQVNTIATEHFNSTLFHKSGHANKQHTYQSITCTGWTGFPSTMNCFMKVWWNWLNVLVYICIKYIFKFNYQFK